MYLLRPNASTRVPMPYTATAPPAWPNYQNFQYGKKLTNNSPNQIRFGNDIHVDLITRVLTSPVTVPYYALKYTGLGILRTYQFIRFLRTGRAVSETTEVLFQGGSAKAEGEIREKDRKEAEAKAAKEARESQASGTTRTSDSPTVTRSFNEGDGTKGLRRIALGVAGLLSGGLAYWYSFMHTGTEVVTPATSGGTDSWGIPIWLWPTVGVFAYVPIRNWLRRRAQPVEGTDASATKEVSARQSSDAPEDPKQAIRTASVQHARKFDFDRKREREAWTELTGDDKTEKFSFHTDPRIRDIPLIDLPKRSASTGKGEVNRTREFLQKKIEEMTQRLHNAEPGTESYLNIQEKRRQLRILKYNAATRVTRQKRYRKGSKPFAHPKGISVHERERRKVLNSLTEEYRARATRLMAAHDEKIHALRVEGSVTADRKERNRIGRQIKTLRRLRATAPQRIADTVPYATKKARLLPAVTPGQRAAKRAATGRNPLIWRDAEKALEKSAALRQQAKTLSDSKPDHWAVPEGRDRYRTERGVHARVLKIYRSVGDRESAWHASSRIPVEMYAPGSRETHKKERQGLAIKLRKTRARAQAINQGSLKGP